MPKDLAQKAEKELRYLDWKFPGSMKKKPIRRLHHGLVHGFLSSKKGRRRHTNCMFWWDNVEIKSSDREELVNACMD